MKNKLSTSLHKDGTRVSISFTKEQYDQLLKIAEINSVSLAWVVRQAVKNYINKLENKNK